MPIENDNSFVEIFNKTTDVVKNTINDLEGFIFGSSTEADIKSKNLEADINSKKIVESDVYNKEAIYFTRKDDIGRVSKEEPGQKFNKGHIDGMIVAVNEAVQKKLISPKGAELFIATQLREARKDFGLHPLQTNFNLTEGKTRAAVKEFFPNVDFDNLKTGDKEKSLISDLYTRLRLIPSTKPGEPHQLKYHAVGNSRYLNEDEFSPYTDKDITYNDYIINGKIAMIRYLSKYGKNMKDEDVVKAWNGKGSKAEEHTRQVFSNLEALKDPSNKVINDYISERINYEGSTYKKSNNAL
jgi:hypothetical protein